MNSGTRRVLSEAPAGGFVVLQGIEAGRGMVSHLAAMGLFPGVRLQVCRNDLRGPVVIGVHGSRVILGRGMAAQVSVAAADEE